MLLLCILPFGASKGLFPFTFCVELKLKIYGVEVFEQEGMAHGESSEHRERVEG